MSLGNRLGRNLRMVCVIIDVPMVCGHTSRAACMVPVRQLISLDICCGDDTAIKRCTGPEMLEEQCSSQR